MEKIRKEIVRDYNDLIEYKRAGNRATNERRKAKLSYEKELARNVKNGSRHVKSHYTVHCN